MLDKKSGHINISSLAGRIVFAGGSFTVQRNMLLLRLVKD
jgi:hypothetical protein